MNRGAKTGLINCLICWGCFGRMGPNHITLRDGGAVCNACGRANPLGNMRKLTMLDLTEPREIWVPWTQSGTAAHALSTDGRTALGPWISFSSAETFERALVYVGITEQQLAEHRRGIEQAGNGCTTVNLIPGNRKNLFKIDWKKLEQ
jgi:hypothetical protein